MARKKDTDNQAKPTPRIKGSDQAKTRKKTAGRRQAVTQISVGEIQEVSGTVNVAGGDIYTGFTAGEVSVLITQLKTTFQPKKFDGSCPYKGLAVFEETDTELFFGRENLVVDLITRIQGSQTVFVTGPSGSGKSSLIRAGLIPALKKGSIKNSQSWQYLIIKPGREPIRALAVAVAAMVRSTNAEDEILTKALHDETIFARWCEIALQAGRDQRVVLFIDQFEEVFTQINKEEERVAFLNLLTHAAHLENGRVLILFSMRSDFVSNCATYPALNAILNKQFVQIGAMQPDELVSAIAQPALRVGLQIDPELIAQIIHDMEGEPGALPLVQFALKDLFDFQSTSGNLVNLKLGDYLQRGGIHKALERHADDSFNHLDDHQKELARSIFSGLIEVGRGTQDTKRTALFNELVPVYSNDQEVWSVIHQLADQRLIITDEVGGQDTITISHEKLIESWPWLKKLVNENRDAIALQNEIAGDSKEWDEHQRDASYLYSGARLANAQEKIRAKAIVLSSIAQAFIETSLQTEETKRREAEDQRQRDRDRQLSLQRQRKTILGVTIALIISVTLAFLAAISSINALRQSQRALASLLAAQATTVLNTQPDLALLLSLESNSIGDQLGESDPIWLGSLITSLNSSPKLVTYLRGHESDVRAVAFSPDGHWLASTGNPSGEVGQVLLWDMSSTTLEKPFQKFIGGKQRFLGVAFSPDGTHFAAAGDDKIIYVWDPHKCCDAVVSWPVNDKVRGLVYAEVQGKEYIVVATSNQITFWDAITGKANSDLTLKIPATDQSVRFLSLAVSLKTNALAAGSDDGNVSVWDLNTGSLKFTVCSYADSNANDQTVCNESGKGSTDIRGVTFNADGSQLISGSSDRRAWLWDARTGALLARTPDTVEGGHSNTLAGVAINPDNGQVATVSWDNTVRLWNLQHEGHTWSFNRIATLAGHANSIWTAAYSPDGKLLATGSSDKTVILWKAEQINQIGTPFAYMTRDVWALAASSNGKQLAAGDDAGNIRVWNYDGHILTEALTMKQDQAVFTVAFSHNNKWLASAGVDQTIHVWDTATGKEVWQIPNAHTDQIWGLAFNPDDTWLASASYDATAKIWDTTTHQQVGKTLQHKNPDDNRDGVFALTFNEDGTQLLVAGYASTIFLWDVSNPASFQSLPPLFGHSAALYALSFNNIFPPLLATTSDDKSLLIWNVVTREHTPPLIGFNQSMQSISFSPGGKRLASATDNNTVLLWQLDSERCSTHWDPNTCQPVQLGTPLVGHKAPVENVVFLSDATMVSSSADGQLIVWNLDKQYWYQHACEIVNRSFYDSEYSQYIEGKVNSTLLEAVNWFSGLFSTEKSVIPAPCIT